MENTQTKTTDFSLDEAVAISSLWMCGSDGHIDDAEISLLAENEFLSSYQITDKMTLFTSLLSNDTESDNGLINVMNREFPAVFSACDKIWKEDFINALRSILLADGEIDEHEINTLIFLGNLMGLTGEEIVDIGKRANEKLQAELDDNSGCFVATATVGDYNHPIVLDLREFRDTILIKTLSGRFFIKIYYQFGPYPAKLISKSKTLKSISFKYLIRPIHRIVTRKKDKNI
jgi:uncharacterized tellurite resistance protein B-like protein